MKRYALWSTLVLFTVMTGWFWQRSCTGNKKDPIIYKDSTLFFLREMDSKQWNQLPLLEHPDLYKRMSNLVGQDWKQFELTWKINHPVVVYDDILLLRGCDSSECYARNFIFLADVHKNNLHIGIRNGTQIIERSEDTTYIPTAMDAWKIRKLE